MSALDKARTVAALVAALVCWGASYAVCASWAYWRGYDAGFADAGHIFSIPAGWVLTPAPSKRAGRMG
ncbi:MAG: hypothetical protein JOZ27_09500 [Caulobacteraceae bacterium]|nr:hypothetical protein [Caulobacteraceae bacterium]